jgi:CRP-like cAMP-binding protein
MVGGFASNDALMPPCSRRKVDWPCPRSTSSDARVCLVLLHTGGDARARRMPTLTELSAASRWASALTPKQRDKVDVEATVRTVPKGGYVCHKGETVNQWIGVLEGLVKIATTSSEGKLAAFAGIPSGGWFGEGSLLKDEPRHYEAIALRESRIAYVPRAVFLSLLADNTGFGRFLVVQLN